jgi:hypothetical protein
MGAAIGLSAWLLATHRSGTAPVAHPAGGETTAAATTSTPAVTTLSSGVIAPVALTSAALAQQARALAQPLYWVGPEAGHRYELSRDQTGNVYVRYLPPGAAAGTGRQLLTVATVPLADAFTRTEALARRPGASSHRFVDGSLAYYRRATPLSAYLVYPGLDAVIQVRDPLPGRARQLVLAGRVGPVG